MTAATRKTERRLQRDHRPRVVVIGQNKSIAAIMDACFSVVQIQDDRVDCRTLRVRRENNKTDDISVVDGDGMMSTGQRSMHSGWSTCSQTTHDQYSHSGAPSPCHANLFTSRTSRKNEILRRIGRCREHLPHLSRVTYCICCRRSPRN